MNLHDKTVVAIDDTQAILRFLKISLEAHGMKFHGTMTASAGLALCEAYCPDVIILDLGLPDKDGLNILPALSKLNKDDSSIPIIVLSVRNTHSDKEQAATFGASAYITKPFDMETLLHTMDQKLNQPVAKQVMF